ncbi:MAG: hypothetical protein OHK0039_27390 [Bacteroidia bacterium]
MRHARAFRGLAGSERWNLLEIFAFGSQVCVYVDGQKAAEGEVPATFDRPGYLLLQVGRRVAEATQGPSQVRYKDLYIKDMQGIPFLGY